ncbi:hypothetical protein ACFLQW_01620 [Candidatus Zixiibacteriota bacterium]
MIRFNKIPFVILLAITLLAFVGQAALAGPGCKAAGKKGCDVKACAAKSACAAVEKTTSASTLACCADGKKCTKEDCLKKCLAMGMTKEQAEEMWAKHQQGGMACHADGKKCSKEDCVKKCLEMGMTKEQAEECWAKHQQTGTTATVTKASATAGCPMTAKASATVGCSKETCVAKLIAGGMTKEEAETKYAACKAAGKCASQAKGGACCPSASTAASTSAGGKK